MSRSFDGSTTSLDNSGSAPVTAVPLTIVCWFKPAAVGSQVTLVGLDTTGTGNHQFELIVNSSNQVGANTRSTTSASGLTTGTVTNGAWNMCGAVFASATSRRAYLNGELGSASGVNLTPSGINEIRVGKSRASSGAFDQFANGLIAYCWIWSVDLSETDLDSLYNSGSGGVDPSTVQGANLVWRSDLLLNESPEPDAIGSIDLTVTAATFSSDNPFAFSAGGQPTVSRFGAVPGMRIGGQSFGRGW